MSKLFKYTFTCQFTVTYTAPTYEDAAERLYEDHDDIDIIEVDCEDFDPNLEGKRYE